MEDIFHEVDEELKREKLLNIWNTYKNYIIGGVVLVFVATSGTIFWQNYRLNQRLQESDTYEAALQLAKEGDIEIALEKLEAISAQQGTYAALADLWRAHLVREGKSSQSAEAHKESLSIYQALQENKKFDSKMRYIASALWGLEAIPVLKAEEIQSVLQAKTGGANPWSMLVQELIGIAYQKEGNKEQAKAIYEDLIKNNRVSTYAHVRIRALMSRLSQ